MVPYNRCNDHSSFDTIMTASFSLPLNYDSSHSKSKKIFSDNKSTAFFNIQQRIMRSLPTTTTSSSTTTTISANRNVFKFLLLFLTSVAALTMRFQYRRVSLYENGEINRDYRVPNSKSNSLHSVGSTSSHGASQFFYKSTLVDATMQTKNIVHDNEHEFIDNNDYSITFRPLVISGPSGVGKGTLINKLVDFYNHKVDEMIDSQEFDIQGEGHYEIFGFSVSHTTRQPRPGEVDGVHYHFTTHEHMEQDIKDRKFIEYAHVHGNTYGTSFEAVQNVIDAEKICILDIDIQGAKRVKDSPSSSVIEKPYFIFIAPPSMEILEKRLRDRGTEIEDAILKRIGNAQSEVDYGKTPGNFDEIIVNDDLESSFAQLRHILEDWYPILNQIPTPSHEF